MGASRRRKKRGGLIKQSPQREIGNPPAKRWGTVAITEGWYLPRGGVILIAFISFPGKTWGGEYSADYCGDAADQSKTERRKSYVPKEGGIAKIKAKPTGRGKVSKIRKRR